MSAPRGCGFRRIGGWRHLGGFRRNCLSVQQSIAGGVFLGGIRREIVKASTKPRAD